MKINYKKHLILGFLLIILFLVIYFLLFNNSNNNTKDVKNIKNTENIIPTIDSSVKIDLKSIKKGEITLTISNEPKKTDLIEFELIYKVLNNDISEGEGEEGLIEQGALGKCYKFNNYWQCGESDSYLGRKIILGTCSSGTCRYHNVVGNIKIILKFNGDYGQRIFEKEYQL